MYLAKLADSVRFQLVSGWIMLLFDDAMAKFRVKY